MKARELYMRCLKARFVSWVNTNQVAAIVPTIEGPPIILAVYNNGKYVQPERLHVPSSPAEMWGPDGPIYRGQAQPPQEPPPPAPGEQGDNPDGEG